MRGTPCRLARVVDRGHGGFDRAPVGWPRHPEGERRRTAVNDAGRPPRRREGPSQRQGRTARRGRGPRSDGNGQRVRRDPEVLERRKSAIEVELGAVDALRDRDRVAPRVPQGEVREVAAEIASPCAAQRLPLAWCAVEHEYVVGPRAASRRARREVTARARSRRVPMPRRPRCKGPGLLLRSNSLYYGPNTRTRWLPESATCRCVPSIQRPAGYLSVRAVGATSSRPSWSSSFAVPWTKSPWPSTTSAG